MGLAGHPGNGPNVGCKKLRPRTLGVAGFVCGFIDDRRLRRRRRRGVSVGPPVKTGGGGVGGGVLTGGSPRGGSGVSVGVGGVTRVLTRAVSCWFVELLPTSCPNSWLIDVTLPLPSVVICAGVSASPATFSCAGAKPRPGVGAAMLRPIGAEIGAMLCNGPRALQRTGTLQRTRALQRAGALQRSGTLERTSALERAAALQWTCRLLRSRPAGRRRLCRSGALQRPGTLQRPSALKRTSPLLRPLAWLGNALVALLRAGRALRLLGLSLLSWRWLALRLLSVWRWRLRLRRCRHQQHRGCRNTLRPKCNFSHMDQPHRRGTPPLQPEFERLRPLGPLRLIEADPTQADCQNTELHAASQEPDGLQGIGRGSAVFMSDALKAQPEQVAILYAAELALKAARSHIVVIAKLTAASTQKMNFIVFDVFYLANSKV